MCGEALFYRQVQNKGRGYAAEFIKSRSIGLGVGTDLVDVKALRDGNAHIITERAKQFIEIVREARAG